jgi:hypothetical protein
MANKKMISDPAREVALAAMSAVYDKQGIDMLKQGLENTKSEKAIAPVVGMAATSIMQHLGPKAAQLPEEDMWGKDGVVQSILGSLFEVAKELGYNAPHSQLKTAYEFVDEQIGKSGFGDGPQAQQGGPQGQPNPAAMGGAPQQGMAPQGQPGAPTGNLMAQGAMANG